VTGSPKNKGSRGEIVARLLIVDDEERNLRLLEAILVPSGYEIELAGNGEAALSKIENRPPDLVLLDIMMPRMDGFQVCERLKSQPQTREIPVVFLTAKTDSESIVRAFEVGAVDYVSKPFKTPELLARVRTHVRLKETQEALKRANATKGKFFSIITHDLKNPFNALLGYSGVLLKKFADFDDNRRIQMITTIRDASKNAYDLLENLLDWSRKESGQMARKPEKIALRGLVEQNIGLVQAEVERKQIRVLNLVDSEMLGYGDVNMIRLVLRNLISNALKFTPDNGQISIECRSGERELEIAVVDTGVGIAAETLPRLFRLEEHFSTEGTRNEKGSGLGLILCKEFVEENGGAIRVESQVGVGSRFVFTLPRYDRI